MKRRMALKFGGRAALVALLLGGGCASVRYGIGSEPYAPWFGHSDESRAIAFRAARRVIEQYGPSEIEVFEQEHRVVAALDEQPTTRDLVIVEVHERGELMIDFRTQLFDGGRWITGSGVCGSYSYARERLIAERIADYASAGASEVALAERARK